jgi:hypothetical protein
VKPATNIGVCIGTYGDYRRWADILNARAWPSVARQTARPAFTRWVHGKTLHDARNHAAADFDRRRRSKPGDWLVFLDADDELDPRYLEAIHDAATDLDGADWLLQPATIGVYPDGTEDAAPVVIPPKPLLDGNYLVIGTAVRSAQFHRVGGFADWPYCEDWDLWIRCWLDGAQSKPVPDAIYRVHVNPTSRNNCDRATQVRVYNQIRSQYLGLRPGTFSNSPQIRR